MLVTGHTGFKGGWLALWLKQLGAEVCGVALEPYAGPSLCRTANVDRVLNRHEILDIRDNERLHRVFTTFEPEYVFHLAAQALVLPSYENPKETFDVNVGGTVNVLECTRRTPSVRVLVNVTSDKCYENRNWVFGYRETDVLGGADPYSASKSACEMVFNSYARSFFEARRELGAASVRAGNVVGGGDWAPYRIVPDCIRALLAGQPIRVRRPDSVRPWQHVLEPLGGYLLLAARLSDDPQRYAGAWNFGPSDQSSVTVAELVSAVVESWGDGEWMDVSHESAGSSPETASLTLSSEKARRLLGWRSLWDVRTTVQRTVDWYRRTAGDPSSAAQVCLEQIEEFAAATSAQVGR